MNKHLYGEYLPLMECDDDVVCGHVSTEVFNQSVRKYSDWEGFAAPENKLKRLFARWVPVKNAPYDLRLCFCRYPARGAFPVTVFEG